MEKNNIIKKNNMEMNNINKKNNMEMNNINKKNNMKMNNINKKNNMEMNNINKKNNMEMNNINKKNNMEMNNINKKNNMKMKNEILLANGKKMGIMSTIIMSIIVSIASGYYYRIIILINTIKRKELKIALITSLITVYTSNSIYILQNIKKHIQ